MDSSVLEQCRQAVVDWPARQAEVFDSTLAQRPYDRSRKDSTYIEWDASVCQAAKSDYLPYFLKATTEAELQGASAVMASALVETYRRTHTFGGKMHVNTPQEEDSTWNRTLARFKWLAPERAVLVLWLPSRRAHRENRLR